MIEYMMYLAIKKEDKMMSWRDVARSQRQQQRQRANDNAFSMRNSLWDKAMTTFPVTMEKRDGDDDDDDEDESDVDSDEDDDDDDDGDCISCKRRELM